MPTLLSPLILFAAAALSIWCGARAAQLANVLLRRSAVGLAAVLATGMCTLTIVSIAGLIKLHSRHAPVPAVHVAGTVAQVQRGEALANSFCGACHSRTGALTGGQDIGKELSVPVGSFVSSNLTPAGPLGHWSDGEIFLAIRNGIGADGTWLTIMSYTNAGRLSDDDIQSLIAYLRAQPAAGGQPSTRPTGSVH